MIKRGENNVEEFKLPDFQVTIKLQCKGDMIWTDTRRKMRMLCNDLVSNRILKIKDELNVLKIPHTGHQSAIGLNVLIMNSDSPIMCCIKEEIKAFPLSII